MPQKIAVCVCTRRRPKMLSDCLASLVQLYPIPYVEVDIIVVENDDLPGKAAATAAKHGALYQLEMRQGIPQARNAALKAARSVGATHVAFIDDDEEAAQSWLGLLWACMQDHAADVVQGPVHYRYPADTPKWRTRSGWGTPRAKTGTLLPTCATNNVLFDLAKADGLQFDEERQFGGGEDIMFFDALAKRGCKLVFCAEAVVCETVTPDRLSLRGNVRKSFSKGICTVRDGRDRGVAPRISYRKLVQRALFGGLKVAVSPLVAVAHKDTGMHALMSGARHISYAAGVIAALCGVRSSDYYKTTTGY